ncbi:MAG: HNH endonuclease [Oscillospiraceae bacterium]|nr:HNH endonuclease [Oscillospiraceae bacterium]
MGHVTKKLDLTGQRFGKLTVLGPAENIGGKTAWRCRCSCGRETVVKTYHLRCGHTKTCGCRNGAGGPRHALGLSYIDGTCVEMLQAKTVRRNNTSGVPGVEWQSAKQRWRATSCFKGKRHYLGSYSRFEDAVKARKRGEEEYHDRFLREFAQTAAQP